MELREEAIQLDKDDRREVERVILKMRKVIEAEIDYKLKSEYDLESEPDAIKLEDDTRENIKQAIKREAGDRFNWQEALERYKKSVGYTIVNRLSALRCVEERNFLERAVTKFREDRVTPAARTLIDEEFLTPDQAILTAYDNACEKFSQEIEILFDTNSPYSLLLPEADTYRELCNLLDELDRSIWLADDILGWVYEYYNAEDLEQVREKARNEGLDSEDTTVANQFYTPHWVVRMLTDNSLGKLYLEKQDSLQEVIEEQKQYTVEERKKRDPNSTKNLTELCTYLVPSEEGGEATEFEDPSEIRVIDPACGSGHFLLYAFDILERIWWQERPDIDRKEIPGLILENNLYGVDLDLRACQLAAFNLYLKARRRAEAEGANGFELPKLNIVCSDAKIADLESAKKLIEDKVKTQDDILVNVKPLLEGLEEVLETFEEIPGLGSLLDVKGTLKEKFNMHKDTLFENERDFNEAIEKLHEKIEIDNGEEQFLARDIRDFLQLTKILTNEYDVALMNPPYGHRSRMPEEIKNYVEIYYNYYPEYYISFFELNSKILKSNGEIGMLIPSSFMYKKSFRDFREDFIGDKASFRFLAEFGLGILDNATVPTVGTVVSLDKITHEVDFIEGVFIRLHDLNAKSKEKKFLKAFFEKNKNFKNRVFRVYNQSFKKIPGASISYWVPEKIRDIYDNNYILDSENAKRKDVEKSKAKVKQGLATAKNDRFVKFFFETQNNYDLWIPYPKGGEKSWVLPKINEVLLWNIKNKGKELKRYPNSSPSNEKHYFKKGIVFNNIKTKDGRRFGFLNKNSIFSHVSDAVLVDGSLWVLMAYLNSSLITYLMIAQTTDRHWEVGEVSNLPWYPNLDKIDNLEKLPKEISEMILSIRRQQFDSPYYNNPLLFNIYDKDEMLDLYKDHPHRDFMKNKDIKEVRRLKESSSLEKAHDIAENYFEEIQAKLKDKMLKIDEVIFDYFELTEEEREEIYREIDLRTGEDPREAQLIPEAPSLEKLVKRMILHLVMKILQEESEGLVPLTIESADEEDALLTRLEDKFEELFGQHAEDKLEEVDEVLGDEGYSQKLYPNLRNWLKDDLFEFHISEFENTPIIWKLTTEDLMAGAEDVGFSCLLDYHSLDVETFDKLRTKYLEPRKVALRERRNAANQRRNDSSLDAEERQSALEEYERCRDNMKQIEILEDKIQELMKEKPRNWDKEDRDLAKMISEQAKEFQESIEAKLDILEELKEKATDEWFEEVFSPKFYENVEKYKEERWLDTLRDIQEAGKQYSQPSGEPVEAHLYDLFVYAEKALGSTHYSSNGVLFLYYYFKKGEDYLTGEGDIKTDLKQEERLLAKLAQGIEKEVELGKKLLENCKEIKKRIPNEWVERALKEITEAGYNPNKKHGVEINIKPLHEANLMPDIVSEKVL